MCRPTWDTLRLVCVFVYGPFTLYGRTFQNVQLTVTMSYQGPATPVGKPTGLASSAFVRHYLRNLLDFFSFRYWDVSLPRVSPSKPMDSVLNNWTLLQLDFSIRISPDQSLCAAPRSFSQLATSFIACQCQGLLHALLVA